MAVVGAGMAVVISAQMGAGAGNRVPALWALGAGLAVSYAGLLALAGGLTSKLGEQDANLMRQLREEQRRATRLHAIIESDTVVAAAPDVTGMARALAAELVRLAGASACRVALAEPDCRLRVMAGVNAQGPEPEAGATLLSDAESLIGSAAFRVGDAGKAPGLSPAGLTLPEDTRGMLLLPILAAGQAIGVAIVGDARPAGAAFTRRVVEACRTVTEQAAFALDRGLRHRAARAHRRSDHRGSGHGHRQPRSLHRRPLRARGALRHPAGSRACETDAEQLAILRRAVTLHDIGKVAVPDSILRKPGALSAPEFEIVKTHPTAACAILRDVPFLSPEMDLILSHHERYDGNGYPRGLRGDDIRSARVFSWSPTPSTR